MADTNVSIATLNLSGIYYFPGCTVYRHLDKDITVIPIPQETMGLDLLMCKDSVRITGRWDDNDGANSINSALARMKSFWALNSVTGGRLVFRWSSGSEEEMLLVMAKPLDISKTGGEGKSMELNFNFAVVSEIIP